MYSKRINNKPIKVSEVTGLKGNTRIAEYSVFAKKFKILAASNFSFAKSRSFTSLYP